MTFYSGLYSFARPFLFKLDAEQAHQLTLKALRMGLVPPVTHVDHPSLAVTLWNKEFPNPVGLAAGFDKNAEVIGPMLKLGFGFVEAGTVTPKPQEGNPKPRVFRDPQSRAVINRMGFPNLGATNFQQNFSQFLAMRPRPTGVVGINIGMNKDQTVPARDYTQLVRLLGPMADYLTINISSPNTAGLRDLQQREPLTELITAIQQERANSCGPHAPPLLVKLAPDLSETQADEIAHTLVELKIDGIILTNTTLSRPSDLPASFATEKGGLSGAPLTQKSTEMIARFYRLTEGKIPIIGAGGILSGRDAYAKIRAGASLVQVYSGLIFHGPELVQRINRDLITYLKRDGYTSITQAVGADHQDLQTNNSKTTGTHG